MNAPRNAPNFRLRVDKLTPDLMAAMEDLDAAAEKVSLDRRLLELIRTRASQINGCAYCTDAHGQEALNEGVTSRQILGLTAWRDCPFFDDRERAALALTEAITTMAAQPVTNEVWRAAGEQFSELELAELTWVISIINVWNRLAGTARPWLIT